MSPVEVDESLWNGWINEHDAREELEVQVRRVESLRNRHNPCQWDPIVAWERMLQAGLVRRCYTNLESERNRHFRCWCHNPLSTKVEVKFRWLPGIYIQKYHHQAHDFAGKMIDCLLTNAIFGLMEAPKTESENTSSVFSSVSSSGHFYNVESKSRLQPGLLGWLFFLFEKKKTSTLQSRCFLGWPWDFWRFLQRQVALKS